MCYDVIIKLIGGYMYLFTNKEVKRGRGRSTSTTEVEYEYHLLKIDDRNFAIAKKEVGADDETNWKYLSYYSLFTTAIDGAFNAYLRYKLTPPIELKNIKKTQEELQEFLFRLKKLVKETLPDYVGNYSKDINKELK